MRSSYLRMGGAVIVIAWTAYFCCRYGDSLSGRQSIAFKNAMEFKDFAVSHGLFFHSGTVSGQFGDNLYIADHPITLEDLDLVCTRRDCGLTPSWRGVLWVCVSASPKTNFGRDPTSIGGTWRIWGNVLVAGDEALMDRIEEFCTGQ